MKKLRFLIPFFLVVIGCIYSYLWLEAAENMRSAISKEVEQAKELGIMVKIEDYKYSSFPFAVSVTPQNATLVLNNSINGKSFLVRIPDVTISCSILIDYCHSSIDPDSKIEILEKELKTPLYEIKFINGLSAFTKFSKSYLIAHFVEKKVLSENLIEQLGFESSEIAVNNLATNQEVSKVRNLMLNENFNFTDDVLPLSSIKFGFEMTNVPDTSFYLSAAFNKFMINANVDNFRLQENGDAKTKEVKINKLSCTLDKSSIDTKGKVILSNNSLPQALDLNITVTNYDYLVNRALQFSHQENLVRKEEQFQLIKKIVEKVINAPYGSSEQATFAVKVSKDNSANAIVGSTSLNEILQMTLGQYNRTRK
jgi:hypothetical protein